jgi:hypothetical protein
VDKAHTNVRTCTPKISGGNGVPLHSCAP